MGVSTVAETRLPALLLASDLHGDRQRLFDPVGEAFRAWGQVEIVPTGRSAIAAEPAHVLLVLTGGTEREALAFAEHACGPIVLLSHPGHNSLPAALEIAARLQQDRRPVRLVHLGTDPRYLRILGRAIVLARSLAGQRVGLIGEPSSWLVASSPDPQLVHAKLGLSVVRYPLEAVLSRLPAEVQIVQGEGRDIGDDERRMAARVHAALARLVEDEQLSALSIACFGLLPHRMTACWAVACLSDSGVPGGCEGDLPALLALMIAQELTGGPGFLANPADVDLKQATLTLAHCTVPLALTRSHTLRTHFESGLGLAIAGMVTPGPYTLVRFGGARLERGFFVEGTVLPDAVGRDDLCRTQLRFRMARGALERLLSDPLGNHHVLIPGHHRAVLDAFCGLFLAREAG